MKHKIGKEIGGCLYMEESYLYEMPAQIIDLVLNFDDDFPDYEYKVIKWNKKDGSVSLLQSPDFDTADEPSVLGSVKVYADGSVSPERKHSHVYHHKWMFVGSDYEGFDLEESKQRSKEIERLVEKSDKKMSQLGTKKAWDAFLQEYAV